MTQQRLFEFRMGERSPETLTGMLAVLLAGMAATCRRQASNAAWAACVLAARCWNLSTRPAVSTNFCWPV